MARDWKAVYARRKARAVERGSKSYWDERRKIERGKIPPVAPNLVRSPHTKAAQRQREFSVSLPPLFELDNRTLVQRMVDAAVLWSSNNGRTSLDRFDPAERAAGVTYDEYVNAYYFCWVAGDERYKVMRHRGGSDAMKYYMVYATGYCSLDFYETRYGSHAPRERSSHGPHRSKNAGRTVGRPRKK